MGVGMSGMISGLDTDSIVKAMVSSYTTKKDNLTKAQTKLQWKMDAWKTLNNKVYSFYSKTMSTMRFSSNYMKKATSISDPSIAKVTAASGCVNGTQSLKITQLAAAGYLTGNQIKNINNNNKLTGDSHLSVLGITDESSFVIENGGKETTITVNGETTVSDLLTQMKAAGVNASFDEANQRFYISAKDSGEANDFKLLSGGADGENLLQKLGLTPDDKAGDNPARVKGQDAKIYLNGVEYKNSSNTITVNGLTITATETTGDRTVSITTSDDTDSMYDMIRDFLSEYNSLINEMDKLYNADTSKGYEPLTDDEKKEMSEDEIEKWETKIKDSLLRRDSTLNSVAQVMKSTMQQGITIGSKTYYLSDFGIGTQGYMTAAKNEKSMLHIDGDEEDVVSASKSDKLMGMILSDPDTVSEFFGQLVTNLYDKITDKMGVTDLSSSYTLYNDKQMQSEYSQYTTRIKQQEKTIQHWEDYYYKQFTAMETALARLNSQQSSLSSLLSS